MKQKNGQDKKFCKKKTHLKATPNLSFFTEVKTQTRVLNIFVVDLQATSIELNSSTI